MTKKNQNKYLLECGECLVPVIKVERRMGSTCLCINMYVNYVLNDNIIKVLNNKVEFVKQIFFSVHTMNIMTDKTSTRVNWVIKENE